MAGICLRVEGERALFARPEFSHDAISYDLMTPYAAQNILAAIHAPAGAAWVVDAIRILNPVRRECVEEQDRRVLMLRDVCYHIDAHVEPDNAEPGDAARHVAAFISAVRSARAPDLGRAGCHAVATLLDAAGAADLAAIGSETVDHGWLLHGMSAAKGGRRRFFRACATGGLVRVPQADSPLLFG